MAKQKYIEVGKLYPLRARPEHPVKVLGIARKGRGYTIHYRHTKGFGRTIRFSSSLTEFCSLVIL